MAFDDLELTELTLNVFSFNHAGIACYRSLGFRQFESDIGCCAAPTNLRMKIDRVIWDQP
jgi:RimJ/RimL family protein N-acetyltransferase